MRPFFGRDSWYMYPLFSGIGGSFGWWLQSVEGRQTQVVNARKQQLLEKRARRLERESQEMAERGEAAEGRMMGES